MASKPTAGVASVAVVLSLLGPGPAAAQPADPTSVKVIPRVLQEDGERPGDPDLLLKRTATEVVNREILDEGKRNQLIAISFGNLSRAIQDFNRNQYGTSHVFLKGGLASKYQYVNKIRGGLGQLPKLREACDAAFGESDIDFEVYTDWKGLEQVDGRGLSGLLPDVWLNTGTPHLELGYELLNDQVISALEKTRLDLIYTSPDVIKPALEEGQLQGTYALSIAQKFPGFNAEFRKDPKPSFLKKWFTHLKLGITWTDVIVPSKHVYNSVPYPELYEIAGPITDQNVAQALYQQHPFLGDVREYEKVEDIRSVALPDRVVLPGPNLRLLYTHWKGKGLHGIYLTSNYSQIWPSDPTLDTNRYTKFALHRLKLVIPFRFEFTKNMESADVSKIIKHSLEYEDDAADFTYYSNLYGVGGELVDVGVDHPVAYLSHKIDAANELEDVQVPVGNATLPVKYAGKLWLIRDLKTMAFDIVGLPWKKPKYAKRTTRLLCLTLDQGVPLRPVILDYLTCLDTNLGNNANLKQCRVLSAQRLSGVQIQISPPFGEYFWGADDKLLDYSLIKALIDLPQAEHGEARKYLKMLFDFYSLDT